MKLLTLEQNTPEWEAFRKTRVGASDIGILMEGREREIHDLLQEKRGLKEKYVTDAMRGGNEMEAEAIEWLIDRTAPQKITALHDTPDDWLMASFDFFDAKNKKGAEIKCPIVVLDMPNEHKHYKRWWWQIQAQMAVSGLKKWELVVYSPGKQAKETIERDEGAIVKLKEKGRWFFDLIINFGELSPINEMEIRDDDNTSEWASYFRAIDAKIKELEEAKTVLRDEGIAMANNESFQCNGVKVQKVLNKGRVDYEAACKANNIDVSIFMKAPKTEYTWRVTAS